MECYINSDGTLVVNPTTETEKFAMLTWAKTDKHIGQLCEDGLIAQFTTAEPPPTEDQIVAGVDEPEVDKTEETLKANEEVAAYQTLKKMSKPDLLAKLREMPEAKGKFNTKTSVGNLQDLYTSIAAPITKLPEEPVHGKDTTKEELKVLFGQYLETLTYPTQEECDTEAMKLLAAHGSQNLSGLEGQNRINFIVALEKIVCQSST